MVASTNAEVETSTALVERLVKATPGGSVASLADLLGVSTQAIYNAKNKGKIPKSWIIDVAEKTGASADWLLFGRGGTALDYRDLNIQQMESTRPGTALDAQGIRVVPEALTAVVSVTTPEYIECMDCQLTMVPMVEARLSAGTGSFETGGSEERRYAFRSDWINSKGQPSKMVLMRVAGDSMEPYIFNNDTVLLDQSQTTPRAGGLFAVGVEDVVYIKMVDTEPGKILLKSYNEAYKPLEIDTRGDLADGIRIIGRAVWIGRELY